MKKNLLCFRLTSVFLLVILVNYLILPEVARAQSTDCQFDAKNPTLDSARRNFLALDYKCAEEELTAFLQMENIAIEQKANAHVLLAEVYYAKVRDDTEKRDKVINQFVAAFESYRDWKGELNIKSAEFMSMMKEAQVMVDAGAVAEPVKQETIEPAAADTTKETAPPPLAPISKPADKKKKKAWYTQWWAIGLGVGAVAAVVVMAGGGGGGGDTGDAVLPDFPPRP